ncbi:MAG: hypothetical protein CFE34_06365 [Rhodobacteraceae bacterium PARR1]|nr:MAG: hypothetical protein CFE34_06365 [Rhodobacteraceae bacterium PARR1]
MIDDLHGTGFSHSKASTTITGFFDSRLEADTAADRLRGLGLSGRVAVTAGEADSANFPDADGGIGTNAGEPRGFFDALSDFFFPDDDRSTFAEGLARGGYLVTVADLSPDDYDRAMDVLEDAGAVDIDQRAESWRAEGWTGGHGGERTPAMDLPGGVAAADWDSAASSGAENRPPVGKRDTGHGRTRVRSYVVEAPMAEPGPMTEEEAERDDDTTGDLADRRPSGR